MAEGKLSMLGDESKAYYRQKFMKSGIDPFVDLSLEQLRRCLVEFGLSSLTDQQLTDIKFYFDRKRGHQFSLMDLLDTLPAVDFHYRHGDELLLAFKVLDEQNNGYLRLPMIMKSLTSGPNGIPAHIAAKIIDNLVRKYDSNHDGKFDYVEFLEMFYSGANPFIGEGKSVVT